MVKPADFSESMPSAGGRSSLSSWPARKAARRELASGIGISTTLSTFAIRLASQYLSQRARSASCRGTTLVIRNGPVPAAGKVATFAQSRPAFSNEAGGGNKKKTALEGKEG